MTEERAFYSAMENDYNLYFDAHVDGWQAYCAGKDKRSNPYKHEKGSMNYWEWLSWYGRAKEADEKGLLEGVRETATAAYYKRHKRKKR